MMIADPTPWVPPMCQASKAPSGVRGRCIHSRSLHLREQYVAPFTADRHVCQATGSYTPRESIACIVLSSSKLMRTPFDYTLSSLMCQHREHALSFLIVAYFHNECAK